jgi:serine protease Do
MGDQPGEAVPSEFGLHVEELTPDRGRRVGVEGQKGVVVTEVDPASFADDLNFVRGDVIIQVNGEAVTSVADYRKAVSKLKHGSDVVFKVLRRQDSDRILTTYLSGKVPADNQQ